MVALEEMRREQASEVERGRRGFVALDERPSIVFGVPAYNEERTIAKVVLQAKKCADVVVVCDDGSSDYTAEIAQNLGAVVVRHGENQGYGAAIQSLFHEAKKLDADVLVTFDGDGQHNVDDVSALLKPILNDEADIVVGSRFVDGNENGDKSMPWYRGVGIKAITKLTKSASKCNVSDAQNGLRAYNKAAIDRLALGEKGMGVSVEILLRAKENGLRLTEVPATCTYDNGEKTSKQHPLSHGTSVLMSLVQMIVEDHPLLVLGVPGAVILLGGILFGVWMMQMYAATHRIVTNVH